MQVSNPILNADFPDPDVIRVGDTYYMVSTSMHLFPGAQILRSHDLLCWEHCGYVFERLGETPVQRLDGGHIYGKGMWAASFRHNNGLFHILFTSNDTKQSYHYIAMQPEGPWERREICGLYYDPALLFDDNGRVYIAHGCREINLTEMRPDLSEPLPGGLQRVILRDSDTIMLGWEGSHLHKINGRYYLFNIHWERGGLRAQGCHTAETLDSLFTGGVILHDDFGGTGNGIAQGGIIDTPEGQWYLMLFQDHGAVGRMPVLVPMHWRDGMPAVDPIPRSFECPVGKQTQLYASDTLRCQPLFFGWQWNHEPHNDGWRVSANGLTLTTDRVVSHLEQSVNTLTQRCFGAVSEMEVTVDGADMRAGDFAGICALQGCYAHLALVRAVEGFALVLTAREATDRAYAIEPSPEPVEELVRIAYADSHVRLRCRFNFHDDTVCFDYRSGYAWIAIGGPHKLIYRLDHFMGCRVGLFAYATQAAGGSATFADFTYLVKQA